VRQQRIHDCHAKTRVGTHDWKLEMMDGGEMVCKRPKLEWLGKTKRDDNLNGLAERMDERNYYQPEQETEPAVPGSSGAVYTE